MLHFVGVFALVFAGMILFGMLVSVTWEVANMVTERFGHPIFGLLCWLFWIALGATIVITSCK